MKHGRTVTAQSKPHFRVLGTGVRGAEGGLGEQRGQPRKTRAGACQTACDGDGMQKAVGCLSLGRVRGVCPGGGSGVRSEDGALVRSECVVFMDGHRYHGWPSTDGKEENTTTQDRSCRRRWLVAKGHETTPPPRPMPRRGHAVYSAQSLRWDAEAMDGDGWC